MKKALIQMLVLLILVATLVSCETLSTDSTTSPDTTNSYDTPPKQQQSLESKFMDTWVYIDTNFSKSASMLGFEDWPSDSKVELAFSFLSDSAGTYSVKITANDEVQEVQREFIWSCDSLYPSWVLAVMRDNTAESYNLYYENALFLSMDDKDLGKIYFVKQE